MEQRQNKKDLIEMMPAVYRVNVPKQHWNDLKKCDIGTLCDRSLGRFHPPDGLEIDVFNEKMLVNVRKGCLQWMDDDPSRVIDCPLLELMTLVHLLNVSAESVRQDMITVSELKDAHFFQGAHALRIGHVVKRYGYDTEGFKKAAIKLGAKPMDMADASFKFSPFPKIPMYYLLWEGDEEFGPNLSVLFDRSIESHLNADGILGIVGLISDLLANNTAPREL